MSDNKGKGSVVSQIVVAVVIALLVGSSAPWWWKEVFPPQPSATPRQPSVTPRQPSVTPRQRPATLQPDTPKGISPDQFFRTYYTAVVNKQYDLAFSMFSKNWQNKKPLKDDIVWWDSIKQICIKAIQIQNQTDNNTNLIANVRHTFDDGEIRDLKIYFILTANNNHDDYLIDYADTQANVESNLSEPCTNSIQPQN